VIAVIEPYSVPLPVIQSRNTPPSFCLVLLPLPHYLRTSKGEPIINLSRNLTTPLILPPLPDANGRIIHQSTINDSLYTLVGFLDSLGCLHLPLSNRFLSSSMLGCISASRSHLHYPLPFRMKSPGSYPLSVKINGAIVVVGNLNEPRTRSGKDFMEPPQVGSPQQTVCLSDSFRSLQIRHRR